MKNAMAIAVGLLFLSGALGAQAQEMTAAPGKIKAIARKCGDTKALDEEWRGTWHESPIFVSAEDEGVATLLYTAERGRTWTLVLRFANDRSCVLNYGENAKVE